MMAMDRLQKRRHFRWHPYHLRCGHSDNLARCLVHTRRGQMRRHTLHPRLLTGTEGGSHGRPPALLSAGRSLSGHLLVGLCQGPGGGRAVPTDGKGHSLRRGGQGAETTAAMVCELKSR